MKPTIYRPTEAEKQWHGNVEYHLLHLHTYQDEDGESITTAFVYWESLEPDNQGRGTRSMRFRTLQEQCRVYEPTFKVGKKYKFNDEGVIDSPEYEILHVEELGGDVVATAKFKGSSGKEKLAALRGWEFHDMEEVHVD